MEILRHIHGFFDQINPLSDANLAIYFVSIFLFSYSAMGIFLSQFRFTRLVLYIINQIFAGGVLLSWAAFYIITYEYWDMALAVAFTGAFSALYWFWIRYRFQRYPDIIS